LASQAVFVAIVGRGIAAPALGRDHRLDVVEGDLLANGIGVVAAISEQRLHLVGEHPK
jgi:hypothetical protein